MLKWIPTYRRWFLRSTTTHQMLPLALLSFLPYCQESTTMLVYCLDWGKIRCSGTNEIIFSNNAVPLLWLPRGCHLLFYSWASVNARLSPFWFKFSRPFVYTLLRISEGDDQAHSPPTVNWWGAELQLPSFQPLTFRALLQSTESVSLHTAGICPLTAWSGPCCTRFVGP